MVLGALECVNNADFEGEKKVNDNCFFFFVRLTDHEETWKYTDGSGWCYVFLDVRII